MGTGQELQPAATAWPDLSQATIIFLSAYARFENSVPHTAPPETPQPEVRLQATEEVQDGLPSEGALLLLLSFIS